MCTSLIFDQTTYFNHIIFNVSPDIFSLLNQHTSNIYDEFYLFHCSKSEKISERVVKHLVVKLAECAVRVSDHLRLKDSTF